MQRHEMIEAMRGLGLRGMAGAFDEAVTTGLQRKRTTHEILTDLLRAEAAHRHAASIRYRMTAAKLPVVKDLVPDMTNFYAQHASIEPWLKTSTPTPPTSASSPSPSRRRT